MDARYAALARIFDMASDKTRVDHPLCMECTAQLRAGPQHAVTFSPQLPPVTSVAAVVQGLTGRPLFTSTAACHGCISCGSCGSEPDTASPFPLKFRPAQL